MGGENSWLGNAFKIRGWVVVIDSELQERNKLMGAGEEQWVFGKGVGGSGYDGEDKGL